MKQRGAFYETVGCLRDVIEIHLFQLVALLAMEPPAYQSFGAVHGEKARYSRRRAPCVRMMWCVARRRLSE